MDRASDSGSEGWGFESLPAYQNSRYPNRVSGILFCRRGLEQLNANVRWTFAGWVGPQPHLTNISPSVRYLAPSPFRRLSEFKKVLVQMHFSKSPIRTFVPNKNNPNLIAGFGLLFNFYPRKDTARSS